jgi:dihydrofolate reductase
MSTGLIKAILACDEEGGIAKNGTIPWPHNATDLQWFKDNTLGHVVVMGSATWQDSFMPCPLPLRTNVLATNNPNQYPGADEYICGDIGHQTRLVADDYPGLITWVIGGAEVINQTLDVIEEFYISRIPGKYGCDTFLPLKEIEEKFFLRQTIEKTGVTFELWQNLWQKR